MAQHTPGPWSFGTRSAGQNSAEICTVFNVPRLPTEDGLGQGWGYISASKPCFELDEAERQANAQLIAAAPDLLDVAITLRQHLALFCGPDDAIATEILTLSDAAIAKAKGR